MGKVDFPSYTEKAAKRTNTRLLTSKYSAPYSSSRCTRPLKRYLHAGLDPTGTLLRLDADLCRLFALSSAAALNAAKPKGRVGSRGSEASGAVAPCFELLSKSSAELHCTREHWILCGCLGFKRDRQRRVRSVLRKRDFQR